jgi:phage terminase small subunit
VWHEVAEPLRESGRLRPEHAETLAQWCVTVVELRAVTLKIAADGSISVGRLGAMPTAAHRAAVKLRATMLALGKAVGLDPASAARLNSLRSAAAQSESPLAAWKRRHSESA